MNLYDKASLILTPNGFKASKLYSLKPTNGTGDFTFSRTGTATRVNSSGLIESVAINVPRLNYPIGGGCPSILLEPQRTNLVLYSEQLDNPNWGKTNSSISANADTSPNGTLTADILYEDTANSTHYIKSSVLVTSGNSYSFSFFAKANGRNFVRVWEDATSGNQAYFDLVNGTATNVSFSSIGIQDFGNGWFRCYGTVNSIGGIVFGFRISLSTNGTITTYTGDGTSGVYLWGIQLEAGSYTTSYIPTTTASVTRGGDLLSRSNIYTNGYITSDGGTWVVWLKNNLSLTRDNAQKSLYLADISGNNGLGLRNQGTSRLIVYKNISTAISNIFTTTSDTVKIAIKWNGTTADIFVNNNKVASNEIFSITQMENISSVLQVPFYIDFMALYPTPLTDAECAALTTL